MDENEVINTQMHRNYDQLAEAFFKKFKPQMEAMEKGPIGKVQTIGSYDYYALGMQLQQFEDHVAMARNESSVSNLGTIPNIGIDVIAATYATSVMPVLATVSPMADEAGLVYFKNIRAKDTRGNITTGDILTNPRAISATQTGYAHDKTNNEILGVGNSALVQFTGTLTNLPIRKEYITINLVSDASRFGKDDGNGNILGVGLSGTINYETGAYVIDFAVAPAPGDGNIVASYQQDFELSSDIPKVQGFFDSKQLRAEVFALKGTLGMIQNFALKQRFGKIGEQELARDLVSEVNKEIGSRLISLYYANAQGATSSFTEAIPTGVSEYAHRMAFKHTLAASQRVMATQAGRGMTSSYVVGAQAAEFMESLPGFVSLYGGAELGVHVYGTYKGAPVVRVLDPAVIPAKEGLCVYKSGSPFDAAGVYAPWMPLTTTGMLPESPNPLGSMNAAATVAAVDVLVPNFISKFAIV